MNTPDKVKEIVDELRPIIRNHNGDIEPDIYIHRTAVLEALTEYHQDLMSEVEQIDFYGWDENTQRMIKEKIIKSLSK